LGYTHNINDFKEDKKIIFRDENDIEKLLDLFDLDPILKADFTLQLRTNHLYAVKLNES